MPAGGDYGAYTIDAACGRGDDPPGDQRPPLARGAGGVAAGLLGAGTAERERDALREQCAKLGYDLSNALAERDRLRAELRAWCRDSGTGDGVTGTVGD